MSSTTTTNNTESPLLPRHRRRRFCARRVFGGRQDFQPPVRGPYEAGAESSPFSTKHTAKASCGRLGNVNWTSFTLANTSSTTGSARLCNSGRRTGCTVVCAWVPLNASSPATAAPLFCLLDTATSTSKRGLAGTVAPPCLPAPTCGTRVNITFGDSEIVPRTFQLVDNT